MNIEDGLMHLGGGNEIKTCADYEYKSICNGVPGCEWVGNRCIISTSVGQNGPLIKFQGFDQNKSGLTGLGQTILNNFNKSK